MYINIEIMLFGLDTFFPKLNKHYILKKKMITIFEKHNYLESD